MANALSRWYVVSMYDFLGLFCLPAFNYLDRELESREVIEPQIVCGVISAFDVHLFFDMQLLNRNIVVP